MFPERDFGADDVLAEHKSTSVGWSFSGLDFNRFNRKCCNFENGDANRPEMNSVSRCQAGRSNSLSMN